MDELDLCNLWSTAGKYTLNLLVHYPELARQECLELVRRLARGYWGSVELDREFEQCYLELRYPREESEAEYARFFDSPEVVAENHQFKGIMVVELSEYVDLFEKRDRRLVRLMEYASERKEDIHFIFLAHFEDDRQRRAAVRLIRAYIPLDKWLFEPPACENPDQELDEMLGRDGWTIDPDARKLFLLFCRRPEQGRTYRPGSGQVRQWVGELIYNSFLLRTAPLITRKAVKKLIAERREQFRGVVKNRDRMGF